MQKFCDTCVDLIPVEPMCQFSFVTNGHCQPALSWRASGDRQIPLSASDERAFANFRVKNVVFTGTHFCAVLSMVGERAFANFYSKTLFFTSTHFCAFTGGRLCQLVELCSAGSNRVNRRRWSFILASSRVPVKGWSSHSKDKGSRLDKVHTILKIWLIQSGSSFWVHAGIFTVLNSSHGATFISRCYIHLVVLHSSQMILVRIK